MTLLRVGDAAGTLLLPRCSVGLNGSAGHNSASDLKSCKFVECSTRERPEALDAHWVSRAFEREARWNSGLPPAGWGVVEKEAEMHGVLRRVGECSRGSINGAESCTDRAL